VPEVLAGVNNENEAVYFLFKSKADNERAVAYKVEHLSIAGERTDLLGIAESFLIKKREGLLK